MHYIFSAAIKLCALTVGFKLSINLVRFFIFLYCVRFKFFYRRVGIWSSLKQPVVSACEGRIQLSRISATASDGTRSSTPVVHQCQFSDLTRVCVYSQDLVIFMVKVSFAKKFRSFKIATSSYPLLTSVSKLSSYEHSQT